MSNTLLILKQDHLMVYGKDIEHLYHAFMYSLVSLLSGIYPLPAINIRVIKHGGRGATLQE